jgi:hypothetical protein
MQRIAIVKDYKAWTIFVYLTMLFQIHRLYNAAWENDFEWIWRIWEAIVAYYNARQLSQRFSGGTKENRENASQIGPSPSRHSNPEPTEYEAGVSTTRQRSCMIAKKKWKEQCR